MAQVESSMRMKIGEAAPAFTLPSTNGFGEISLHNYHDKKGYLVAFICNHCPFVKHIADVFAKMAGDYQKQGIVAFAISSNDYLAHPEDSPEKMSEEAKNRGYEFPYLIDKSQEVAKAYSAVCTPDFFLFDAEKKLYYRGQFDASRPSLQIPVSGASLGGAMDMLLEKQPPPEKQLPSIGCNIKWKS